MSHLDRSKHLFLSDFVIFLLLGPAFSSCHGRLFKDKKTNEMLHPFTEACMEPLHVYNIWVKRSITNKPAPKKVHKT